MNEWKAAGPHQTTEQRSQLKRTGYHTYRVRVWKGLIVRRGENGKPEYDRCPHAHAKAKVARQCAEKEARRRNREEAKQA